ncbi:MAG: efflux RND transporter periplasmic adaptor subunit [Pseudomonadota bacterium]
MKTMLANFSEQFTKSRFSQKDIPWVSVVALTGLILTGCGAEANIEEKSIDVEKKEEVIFPVTVSPITTGDVHATFQSTAALEPYQEAVIFAKTQGTLEKLFVEEGDIVTQEQPLGQLDKEKSSIELKKMQAKMKKLENELKRKEVMYKKRLVSFEEIEQLQFDFAADKAAFELQQLEVNYSTIKAPIGGVIARRDVDVGNFIDPNKSLFVINNISQLEANIYVPESMHNHINAGQKTQLTFDSVDTKVKATVTRVSPVVNADSGTIKVTIQIDNSQYLLKPGMFARVNILYDTHANTLLIPRTALITEDASSSIFILRENKAVKMNVTTGYSNETHIEIIEPLEAGEQVIISGHHQLKDQAAVKVI